jgi:hypothetical protein
MITFKAIVTALEASFIFKAAMAVGKLSWSLKSKI